MLDQENERRRALFEKLHRGPSTLHGRQEELRLLYDAYHKALHKPSLTIVSGKAGTGKSTLVMKFLEGVRRENKKAIVLQGKFNQLLQSTSAQDTIVAAFAQVSESLKEDHELRARVEQAVGLDAILLVQTIPGLAGSLTIPHGTAVTDEGNRHAASIRAQKQTTFLKFLRAICSPTSPVVLFIDDLQWASHADLDLLTSIFLEGKVNGLVIVIACRIVDVDHQLSGFLHSIANHTDMQHIAVSDLSKDALKEYFSELFGGQDCTELAYSVALKTAGNSFFVKEFLVTLLQENIFSWRNGSWYWNAEHLALRDCDNNDISSFVTNRLTQLPADMRDLLKAAACLGNTFRADTLQYLVKPDKEQRLDDLLRGGEEAGLLVRNAGLAEAWSFAHDNIQKAAYCLIPEAERGNFHLSVGRALRDRMDEVRLEAFMPVVASQLILGHEQIDSREERIHTATLLLRAGRQQARMSKFDAASGFFSAGLDLLGADYWSTSCYNLSLELCNASAEVSYVLADFERLDTLTDAACKHAETFEDTIQIHTTHIYSLGARNMLREAIKEGLAVLEKLDQPIPRSVSTFRLLAEHLKTNWKMSRLSVRRLSDLPEMKDPKKLAVLRLLNLLFCYMYWEGDVKDGLFLTIRSVQLTLQHGLCGMSAIGLAYCASFFCTIGKTERGCLLARVALSVAEMFHAKEWIGRVLCVKTAVVDAWKLSPKELNCAFETACQSCFETGDIEFALIARGHLIASHFLSAEKDLAYMVDMCRTFCDLVHRHKQEAQLSIFAPFLQLVANLSGQSESATNLTGTFLDEEQVTNQAMSKNQNRLACQIMHLCKLILATFLWDFELARDQLRKFERLKQKNELLQQLVVMELFYGGMALLSIDKPEVRKARGDLRSLRSLRRQAPSEHSNKILLLEAELAALSGNATKAMEKFLTSMALSERQLLIHDQALACERTYLFLRKEGKVTEGMRYLNEARALYQRWGCVTKSLLIQAFILAFGCQASVRTQAELTKAEPVHTTFVQ